jgi:hypothetical protein
MRYSKELTLCSKNHKNTNALCEQNAELLNIKTGGI